MNQVEEIKSKLDIVEVIREYVQVKAVGANFQALCPFHNEKSPSFIISPDKQIWHCFGCSRGGDVLSFVMEKEGLNFAETLRFLAPKAGVVLQYENKEHQAKRNRILDILALAGKYYAHILGQAVGKKSKDYLLARGLSEDAIQEWQLGYSPDAWDELYKFLKERPVSEQKYTDEEIFAAGLIIKKEGGRGYYDRFRGRIMFPIWDINNNIIAFTARVSPEKEKTEKMGKYINSPQSAVYDKSRVLFALNKAKMAIREANLAIVVEGQMDVIACHEHGFKNVVASSGTALTAPQVGLLKRFTGDVALLFDMDQAGQMAADRGIKEVLAAELSLKIIVLPDAKDPDECLRNNLEGFKEAVLNAKPMLEYYFAKVSAGLDLENLDNKKTIRDQMFIMINLVISPTEQGYWLKRVGEELGFAENDVREEFGKWRDKQGGVKRTTVTDNEEGSDAKKTLTPAKATTSSREEKLAELLMALIIRFPEYTGYVTDNLDPSLIANEVLATFYRNLIIYYNKSDSLQYESFHAKLVSEEAGAEKLLDKLILLGEKDFYNYESAEVKAELINIINELKKSGRQKKIRELQKEISQAEKEGRLNDLVILMADLKNLMTS
ncbi:DNA primase [Candidatus Falkowbacteria bacterium CG10_big_fil_rev_8_21_14_0_10_37_18]|uniref:DNA primase n=1 Tax=Candidatus Falkowbacteria bacterium CG10_big_fil_rev_8_21_14_0_10_37_18 TaxID=1974562 RepID=A0A2H0V8H3_9BACT|nr:DNA primase [Candidatus Falkowbacteria bacterium]PIR95414.1 MAG: DNA primase [Candidatus Falkowbacteria bacterium CG10_big_fil_rev_8_21_14_0_10_37_18]